MTTESYITRLRYTMPAPPNTDPIHSAGIDGRCMATNLRMGIASRCEGVTTAEGFFRATIERADNHFMLRAYRGKELFSRCWHSDADEVIDAAERMRFDISGGLVCTVTAGGPRVRIGDTLTSDEALKALDQRECSAVELRHRGHVLTITRTVSPSRWRVHVEVGSAKLMRGEWPTPEEAMAHALEIIAD